ncbi:MAG: hypothetical protein IJV98_00635 [Clostridia bacterium]|nr:hypothetical protein [Clostridia bacterium]
MLWIYITALILQAVLCTVTTVGIFTGFLAVERYMLVLAFLIPIWGPVMIFILHFYLKDKKSDEDVLTVEKLRIEAELYKNVAVDDGMVAALTVPIEEALIVNTARERRSIIMDVLNDEPKEYIEFLQKAGNNDDTEVVHYAVTAMVEISKETDYMLQTLEQRYQAAPDDYDVLEEYTHFLWSCLCQNMMQGQVEVVNRKLYSTLINKKLSIRKTLSDYLTLAENELLLKNYTACEYALAEMGERWPEEEAYILLCIRYYAALGRGDEIRRVIDEIERSNRYISVKAREVISFWKK